MRFLAYILLGYLAVGTQVGLAAYAQVNGTAPNVVLMVAVFIALQADTESGLLACFMLGLMTDLVSQQPMGLYALSFALAGLFASSASKLAYKGHPLTHFFLVLVGGVFTAIVLWLYGALRLDSGTRVPMLTLLGGALYSALLAPVLIGVLHRLRGVFGFSTGRRRQRARDDG